MLQRLLLTAGAAIMFAAPLQAQLPLLDVRLGAHAVMPTGDLGDAYDVGFGAYGRIGAPVGPIKLMGSVTWNRLKAANPLVEDMDMFTVQAGPHFSIVPLLDVGVEAAYFTEVEEFGISPNISLGFASLEVTAAYNTTFESPQANWMSLGAGFRF